MKNQMQCRRLVLCGASAVVGRGDGVGAGGGSDAGGPLRAAPRLGPRRIRPRGRPGGIPTCRASGGVGMRSVSNVSQADQRVSDRRRSGPRWNGKRMCVTTSGSTVSQRTGGTGTSPITIPVVSYNAERSQHAKRTSAIIDPPDGLLPAWTLEQVNYYEEREAMTAGRGDSDSWIDRPTGERCIPVIAPPILGFWGMALKGVNSGVAETAGTNNQGEGYSNTSRGGGGPYRIVQSPGYAVILQEQQGLGGGIAGSRVIPLDGRPALAQKFQNWMGSARGHWEGGNTLGRGHHEYSVPGSSHHELWPELSGRRLDAHLHGTVHADRPRHDGLSTATPWTTLGSTSDRTRCSTSLGLYGDYKIISAVICHEGHDRHALRPGRRALRRGHGHR